jgi:A/G-specific adenine glycosylase
VYKGYSVKQEIGGDMKQYQQIHRFIQDWYQRYGRVGLPWRETEDPYHVYISEVMLQQTQVKTVLERYYFPFLERFPTLAALAKADEQEVLKVWEGLGYYSRARNLHKAAKQSKGQLPTTHEGLLALPGIGKNTAHAIQAFAFKQAVPVMEANVKRVLSRFFAITKPGVQELWQLANQLLDKKDPFNYNQAMMDIGALVCTSKSPKCPECPLAPKCQGKASPLDYPAKETRQKIPVRKRHIIIWQDPLGRYYLIKRQEVFLGGLHGFMQYPVKPSGVKKIGEISQTYSHFKLEAIIYHGIVSSNVPLLESGQWWQQAEIEALPLSQADKKILKWVR